MNKFLLFLSLLLIPLLLIKFLPISKQSEPLTQYDIISDVHGKADALKKLLEKMDYQKVDGVYTHKSRKAIFMGDFIDRGSDNRGVIDIVRPMIEGGCAQTIMGNHELNAIFYSTKHSKNGEYLRAHKKKYTEQHATFLKDYPFGSKEYADIIKWFKTLPLFLDLGNVRIIHAYWHKPSMAIMKRYLNKDNTLSNKHLEKAATKKHELYEAIESTLKGYELKLPEGASFKDTMGHSRHKIRIKWWKTGQNLTYRDMAMSVPNLDDIPDTAIDNIGDLTYTDNIPLFIGHYQMKLINGKPQILSPHIACVDFGKEALVAYRWNGETTLSNDNFISVNY